MTNYNKEYYRKNKDKLLARSKIWRETNREKIRESKRIYEARPEIKLKKQERSAKEYQRNKEKYLSRQSCKRKERRVWMNSICLYYGCQNPNCKWSGKFEPCQLDFHHYNPADKVTEVAKMDTWAYDKIIAEIDKCVIVCRNCHPLVHKGIVILTENMMCKSVDYLAQGLKL